MPGAFGSAGVAVTVRDGATFEEIDEAIAYLQARRARVRSARAEAEANRDARKAERAAWLQQPAKEAGA
jgi:hypothetical protein